MAVGVPNELANAYVTIRANLKPLYKGLRMARAVTARAMSSIGRLTGRILGGAFKFTLGIIGKLIRSIKRLAKAAALAFIAISAGILKLGISFEKQLAMVSTMLRAETMPMLAKFKDGVLAIAVKFGQGTKTIAKGLYDILSASVAPAKALDVLTVSAKAAVAGMTETGIAADVITTVLNSFALSADRAGEISDKLFATVQKGKIVFPELASNLGKVASSAAVVGLSMDEMLAAIATMTRGGLRAEEAITSLMATVSAFVRPTDNARKEAKKLGIDLSITGMKTTGLLDVVKKLSKAEDEQLGKIIENVRMFRGMAIILKDVAGYHESLEYIAVKSAEETERAFAKMSDTASFKISVMWAKIKGLGLAIYAKYEPQVKAALDKVNKWFDKNEDAIIEWAEIAYNKIGGVLKKFIEWVKYFKEDWRTALDEALNKLSIILGAMFDLTLKMSIMIGRAIWVGIKQGILGGSGRAAVSKEIKKRALALGYEEGPAPFLGIGMRRHMKGPEWFLEEKGITRADVKQSLDKAVMEKLVNDMRKDFGDIKTILADVRGELAEQNKLGTYQ